MDKLKPCPFCGSDDIEIQFDIWEPERLMYAGECQNCGGSTGVFEEKYEVIAAWNRRAPTNTGEDTTAGAIRQSMEEWK